MRTLSVSTWMILVIMVHMTVARKFDRCGLAREFRRHGIPNHELNDWVCIAEWESSLDTSRVNTYNTDGSQDYGLFQINNRYWCENGRRGKGCNVQCEALLNDDITDDIQCARHIKNVQGWSAWVAWNNRCNGRSKPDVTNC